MNASTDRFKEEKKEKRTIGQTIFILSMLMYSITDS